MRATRIVFVLALLAIALPARSAFAQTTQEPIADVRVSSAYPARNFGTAVLRVDASPVVTSYLRFDVPVFDGSITRATLRVYASNGSTTGFDVRPVEDVTWGEKTITYTNAPPAGLAQDSSGPITSNTWVALDVTSRVQTAGLFAFALTTTTTSAISFPSREASSNRPQLVLETGALQPAGAPTGLNAVAVNAGRIDLSWDAQAGASGGYTIYRGGLLLASTSPGPASYSDTSVFPQQAYTYAVDALDSGGMHTPPSAPATATTPAAPPRAPRADPVVAAAGDIACDPTSSGFEGAPASASCHQRYTSDTMLAMDPDLVLALGDTQYSDGQLWKYVRSYDPSWGRLKSVLRAAIGNHENDSPGSAGFWEYFGTAAGPRGSGYTSFNVGSWHIVQLNSNCADVGGCKAGSPQEQWLRADLAASSAACTVAYWHQPRFSSGAHHGDNSAYADFWRALYDDRADLVLVAHDHGYERFAPMSPAGVADPDGIREFVVGTGGKSLYTFSTTPRATSEVRLSAFGVLKLTLHISGYSWEFVPQAGGTATDAGNDSCH